MKARVQTIEEGHLGDGGTEYRSNSVREVLPQRESWTKQGGIVWTGRGGRYFLVVSPLGDVPEGSETSEL